MNSNSTKKTKVHKRTTRNDTEDIRKPIIYRKKSIFGAGPFTFKPKVWFEYEQFIRKRIKNDPELFNFLSENKSLECVNSFSKKIDFSTGSCIFNGLSNDLKQLYAYGIKNNGTMGSMRHIGPGFLSILDISEHNNVQVFIPSIVMNEMIRYTQMNLNKNKEEGQELQLEENLDKFSRLYMECMNNPDKYYFALGYVTSHNLGHMIALVSIYQEGKLHVGWYDPMFYRRFIDSKSSVKKEEYISTQIVPEFFKNWEEIKSDHPVVIYSLSEIYCRKDGKDIKCPQYYMNAEYCFIYSIYFILSAIIRSDSTSSFESLVKDSVKACYMMDPDKLSRASNLENMQFKIVTLALAYLVGSLYIMQLKNAGISYKIEEKGMTFDRTMIESYNEWTQKEDVLALLRPILSTSFHDYDKLKKPEESNDTEQANDTEQQTQGGGTHTTYKGRRYKVRTGTRGGRYIIVGTDKKKIYLS